MRRWQLQEAKTRFSELVRQAEGGEVWLVTKHGVPRVVVVDVATYERLTVPERRVVSTSGFLLDTNVVSEALRPRPDARVFAWLRAWLDEVLIPQFTHRLLSVDLAVARRRGERTAAARANGTPIGAVDALIADTAARHGLAVATRNGRDFEHLVVEVVDPWMVARPWRGASAAAKRACRARRCRSCCRGGSGRGGSRARAGAGGRAGPTGAVLGARHDDID